MDRAWQRYAQTLQYQDPAPFLVKLREIERKVAVSDLPSKVKQLRTNELKPMRELREAAIFCYGMGQRLGQTVYLARGESQDYDFVASWVVGDQQHLAPVQLKEVVPPDLNLKASLQTTVNGLTKYVDSEQLTVAIHFNQQVHFTPADLVIPSSVHIAALWVFAAITPNQDTWGLWGNFMEEPEGYRYAYPAG